MRVFDKASAEDAAGTVQWSRYLSGSLGSRYWRRRDDRILARVPEGSGPVLTSAAARASRCRARSNGFPAVACRA